MKCIFTKALVKIKNSPSVINFGIIMRRKSCPSSAVISPARPAWSG